MSIFAMTQLQSIIPLEQWSRITQTVHSAQKSSLHTTIASISSLGIPNITPIGTLFLNEWNSEKLTGFFFDTYSQRIDENTKYNPNVCICAVNSSQLFWLKSLVMGQFKKPIGVRLYAKLGKLRPATKEELDRINQRIKPLAWTKGSQLIWSDFTHVREFVVLEARWVKYPKMMESLQLT